MRNAYGIRPSTSQEPAPLQKTTQEYRVVYLGTKKVYFNSRRAIPNDEYNRSKEEKIIDQLENAQLSKELLQDAGQEPEQILTISKHGLRMTNVSNGIVGLRIPLFSLVFTVVFDSNGSGNKYNLALVECSRHKSNHHECHLLQFIDKYQSERFSIELEQVFSEVEKDAEKLKEESKKIQNEEFNDQASIVNSETTDSSGYVSMRTSTPSISKSLDNLIPPSLSHITSHSNMEAFPIDEAEEEAFI